MSFRIRLHCWWFGCSQHPQDPDPVEHARCQYCDELLCYEDMIGIAGVYYISRNTITGWYRLVVPAKCADCGKRFGHHEKCIPF